jgi:hypothetical protein
MLSPFLPKGLALDRPLPQVLEEAPQAIGIGGGGRLVLLQFVRVAGQRVLSV